jgi:sugar phosphate isomerase/epimerase
MKLDQIALQLYTVRDHTQQDMLGTLRAIAEIGYPAVEFAGYGNSSPREIRATLDDVGMRGVSAHVALDRVLNEPQQVIDEAGVLGCEYIVVPFVAKERRDTLAAAQRFAQDLNRIGEQLRGAGLRFGYHNHAFEFEPLDGTTLWDVLVQETDPALVGLEADLCWVYVGGRDPATVVQQLGDRAMLVHAKDWLDDQRIDAPVGDGVLDWTRIVAAADAAGARYYIVEQDHPRDPLNDVRRSFEALRRMT